MNLTVRQLIALEQALTVGTKIEVDGKTWTIHHLEMGDYADQMGWRKDNELACYLRGVVKSGIKITSAERFRDIHDIMMRGAREEDFAVTDPGNLLNMTLLCLRHEHPEVTETEVNKLLSDDAVRELICDIMKIKNSGPMGKEELEAVGGPDPTKAPPALAEASP